MPIGVGVLALTGGLTAFTFAKAIGIGLLGLPRTPRAGQATEVHRSMWTGAGLLALLCLIFGIAPFLVIGAVVDAAGDVTGMHHSGVMTHGWQIGLQGTPGLLAPGLLALGLLGAGGVVVLARRLIQPGPVRLTEAWGCGRELQTAQMEYTATSFGEPLTRVFEDVLNPARDIDVSHIAESRYYTEAAVIHTTLDDAFERRFYRPANRILQQWGGIARRVPNGSVHRYLAFGFFALIVVLVALA